MPTWSKELSLQLDETIALLDHAVSPGIVAVLQERKRNIEEQIFGGKEEPPTPGKRLDPRAWQRVRLAVMDRDNYHCQGCGVVDGVLDVHHIHPIHRGGSNELHNLLTLCRECHERIHPWMQAKEPWTLTNSN